MQPGKQRRRLRGRKSWFESNCQTMVVFGNTKGEKVQRQRGSVRQAEIYKQKNDKKNKRHDAQTEIKLLFY